MNDNYITKTEFNNILNTLENIFLTQQNAINTYVTQVDYLALKDKLNNSIITQQDKNNDARNNFERCIYLNLFSLKNLYIDLEQQEEIKINTAHSYLLNNHQTIKNLENFIVNYLPQLNFLFTNKQTYVGEKAVLPEEIDDDLQFYFPEFYTYNSKYFYFILYYYKIDNDILNIKKYYDILFYNREQDILIYKRDIKI